MIPAIMASTISTIMIHHSHIESSKQEIIQVPFLLRTGVTRLKIHKIEKLSFYLKTESKFSELSNFEQPSQCHLQLGTTP